MGYCFLSPEGVKLTVNSKKKQIIGSKWAKSKDGIRVKMDQGSRLATIVYPPEIVKQTVNSKKNKSQGQSGPRGKMGQKMTK